MSLDEADTNDMRFPQRHHAGRGLRRAPAGEPPALIAYSVGELVMMGDVLPGWMARAYDSDLANDADRHVYYVMRPHGADEPR